MRTFQGHRFFRIVTSFHGSESRFDRLIRWSEEWFIDERSINVQARGNSFRARFDQTCRS